MSEKFEGISVFGQDWPHMRYGVHKQTPDKLFGSDIGA